LNRRIQYEDLQKVLMELASVKRLLDILLAALSLMLLGIPFLGLMLLVRVYLGCPIFFRQVRPGLYGKPFLMTKFRTMTDKRGLDGALLPDAERLTTFGRLLRSTSLDELPELWHVFNGEMSMVGPRPLLMEYLPLYSPEQSRRHEVRPGITGWAQVNGRNAISWEQRFKLDVWYVNNHSVWLDIKILLLTIKKVVKRDGVSAEGEATTRPFTGNS
jgi:lipopolysaccharide/colanic/teichoic acid biosynthesis glycosyltransferase